MGSKLGPMQGIGVDQRWYEWEVEGTMDKMVDG